MIIPRLKHDQRPFVVNDIHRLSPLISQCNNPYRCLVYELSPFHFQLSLLDCDLCLNGKKTDPGLKKKQNVILMLFPC